MCGIFGVVTTERSRLPAQAVRNAINELFRLSESRGKEAAGVAVLTADKLYVYKEAIRATALIRRKEYRDIIDRAVSNGNGHRAPATIIGHSRLVTTGVQENRLNNQPVINAGAVGIHNGIVVNDEELWKTHPEIQRNGQVDSEIIVGLIRRFAARGSSLVEAVRQTFALIKGAASVAVVFDDLDALVLATNNGSLYITDGAESGVFLFASEEYILRTLLSKRSLAALLDNHPIRHIEAGSGVVIGLGNASPQAFSLHEGANGSFEVQTRTPRRQVVDVEPAPQPRISHVRSVVTGTSAEVPAFAVGPDYEAIARLRRCSRCVLPETMPYIRFDEDGVCNYCRHYKKLEFYGQGALERILAPLRRNDGRPDCLVGVSGGRDSCHALHFIKTVLKANPVAYTYDWGMVTDLARRNISRVCGQLGIEHILVSADIEQKRGFIRKNVAAWLKRPNLGMIPLFMAGDKQYFYHANRLKKQLNVPVIILGENMLERTDFKSGFSGIQPRRVDEDRAYTLSQIDRAKIAAFYLGQFLRNPAYLNASMADTVFAYACYYWIRRDYLNLYRFIEWDEDEVQQTLIREYEWETADDTTSTWRIGDGTAPFYNYIYLTVAGFCEFDTFRSNQIREGRLTREEALSRLAVENRPRWKSIRWYCESIGVDFEHAIRAIDRIPKLTAGRRGA